MTLVTVIIAVCLVNGLFSPALLPVMMLAPVWLPEIIPAERTLIFYGASLLVVLGTLVLGGVPAALFERLSGAPPEDERTQWIWLAGCCLLTVPAILRFL